MVNDYKKKLMFQLTKTILSATTHTHTRIYANPAIYKIISSANSTFVDNVITFFTTFQ